VAQAIVFLALLFSIVIAIFAVQNTTSVSVSFLVWGPATMAASVLVLISAALGAAAMLLFGLAREVRMRWRQRSVAGQLRSAQARVAELEASTASSPAATTAAGEPLPPPETASTGRGTVREPTALPVQEDQAPARSETAP
jgi:putative membrane protein